MKKTDLIKPGSPRQNQLIDLARKINHRQDDIEALEGKHKESGNALVRECILQGHDLLKAKDSISHGNWLDWLRIHCPLISARVAQMYMRVATNAAKCETVSYLEQCETLRDAMFCCTVLEMARHGDGEQANKDKAEPWPAYLECISRFGKARAVADKHPLEEWPIEGIEKAFADVSEFYGELKGELERRKVEA